MPEYLAPGVYVEEIPSGSKPIEGVSTSTGGMVGVTERGPVGWPMFVRSYGDYQRIFGGELPPGQPPAGFGDHRFLPFGVRGFFSNGGQRLWIVRVLDTDNALHAQGTLYDRGDVNSVTSALLRFAPEAAGTTPADALFVLDGGALAAAPQRIRIGDGSTAEYRQIATIEIADDATHLPVHLPLARAHDVAASADHIDIAGDPLPSGVDLALQAVATAGADQIVVDAAANGDLTDIQNNLGIPAPQLIEVGVGGRAEYRFIRALAIDAAVNTRATLTLDAPLALEHAIAEPVVRLDPDPANVGVDTATLMPESRLGDTVAFVDDRASLGVINFDDPTDLVIFDLADPALREVRRIGDLHVLTLRDAVGARLAAGSRVEAVGLADDGTARVLTRAAAAGSPVIALDRRDTLAAGDVLGIGPAANREYVVIAALPDRAAAGNDPGIVRLVRPLVHAYPNGDPAPRQTIGLPTNRPATALVFDTAAGDVRLAVSDGVGYVAGDVVRLTDFGGEAFYRALAANADDVDPRLVTVTAPLTAAHAAGSAVVERGALITIQALDAGAWGNRLRISVEDERVGLLAETTVDALLPPNAVRLAQYAGVQAGTLLEFTDPATGAWGGELVKVVDVDRASGTVALQDPIPPALLGLPPGTVLRVRSREFRVTVRLYRRPDPLVPTRNNTVIDEEIFPYLSMDPRHSNYIQRVLGQIAGTPNAPPLRPYDRRSPGDSLYVRVHDFAANNTVRLGPEALIDLLPNGSTPAARLPLADVAGDDSIASITALHYLGVDADDPENRTGLHALRNIDDVSIVAAPGQVDPQIQDAVITHCETMRYRFAVLDGPPPPNDALTDVQAQRQQFDTTRAALYHPWPLLREPLPELPGEVPLVPIPPSGHTMGVYARVDVERGVHKAPANEVLRGVESLSRLLNKAEHDVLNPFPKNINVIRDFRPDNRGLRVWGARVITSDPDYKYVPVRRLLLYLEKSIERGLQWVVFEPNAEPLWARVRRSIEAFLLVVWRNGALEGTKAEQAFFVKCDRTTMTQTDIDNGRLICLIGVAPVKPAEFVIVRIGLKTADAES